MSTGVIISERIIPENNIPNTDVVEYSNTVLTAPISFSPIRKNKVDIPVPIIDIIKIFGNCISSISIGIWNNAITEIVIAAQMKDTI